MTFHSLIIANERSLVKSLIPFLSENLFGQFQLYFGREALVELLDISIINIIPLRRLINTSNAVQISWNQFLAEKKGIVNTLRKVVVTNTEASFVYHQCQKRGYAAPVDVLMAVGVLTKQKYEL